MAFAVTNGWVDGRWRAGGSRAVVCRSAPRMTLSPPRKSTRRVVAEPEEQHTLHHAEVPGLPHWRYTGPDLNAGPLPAVVYFSLTAAQSLGLPPYNSLPASLASQSLRVFSVSLPAHGTMPQNAAALSTWARHYSAGTDVAASFATRAARAIDQLFHRGYIANTNLHLAGLSRGAAVAAAVAARDDRVRSLLLLSPVTKWSDHPDFQQYAPLPESVVDAVYADDGIVRALAEREVRVYMGNRDTLVGTRGAFQLVEAVAEKAHEMGKRGAEMELNVFKSVGMHGHGTPPEVFEEGAKWLERQVEQVEQRPGMP